MLAWERTSNWVRETESNISVWHYVTLIERLCRRTGCAWRRPCAGSCTTRYRSWRATSAFSAASVRWSRRTKWPGTAACHTWIWSTSAPSRCSSRRWTKRWTRAASRRRAAPASTSSPSTVSSAHPPPRSTFSKRSPSWSNRPSTATTSASSPTDRPVPARPTPWRVIQKKKDEIFGKDRG